MRLTLLLAVATAAGISTLTAAGWTTAAPAQLRSVYVAKDVPSLPKTAFVRARDCINRPRACVNGIGGLELVFLTRGNMPTRPTTARVLTDTNCAADHNGISHCLNVLKLTSGRRITVRHDHSMANDPCLAPGERVYVRALR